MSITLTLIVIPGSGARTANLPDASTIENLIVQENLHGRDIIVDGQAVLPADFPTTLLVSNSEVFATGSVKGNSTSPSNAPSQTGRPSGGGRGNNAPRGK